MVNTDLARAIVDWDLLDEKSQTNSLTIAGYIKWSFTTSFLQLVNAWQWFFAGILLKKQTSLLAQETQMYYYSIYFSYGSFLSTNFKGHYSLKEIFKEGKFPQKIRKEVWLAKDLKSFRIETKDKGKGGEHEVRANWFFDVFDKWEDASQYPAIRMFKEDRHFHSGYRNLFTYSISGMADELYSRQEITTLREIKYILLELWEGTGNAAEIYPEECWALEHIRLAMDVHVSLLNKFSGETPYKSSQFLLIENLIRYHEHTKLDFLLRIAFDPFIKHMNTVANINI